MHRFYFILFAFFSFAFIYPFNLSGEFNEKWKEKWSGSDSSFSYADSFLHLNAPPKGKIAYISTHSTAIDNTTWTFTANMRFNPSGSNYCRFYLVSDQHSLTDSLNGYFIQIGNAKDQILLYKQNGKSTKKLAAGTEMRLNRDSVCVKVKAFRTDDGEWTICSQLNDETSFSDTFSTKENSFTESFFAGFYCKYSSAHCADFSVGHISICEEGRIDETAPTIEKYQFSDSTLTITFSKSLNRNKFSFQISPYLHNSTKWNSGNKLTINLLEKPQRGTIYTLELIEYADRYGNYGDDFSFPFGKTEEVSAGDLIITEIMFDPADGCEDYVEIYNNSDKLLDLSQIKVATYRGDSTIYAAKKIPSYLLGHGHYVAICANDTVVRSCFPNAGELVSIQKMPTFGAKSGSVVIVDKKSEVIDDFRYSSTMHSALLKNKKGRSLERISANATEWASAAEAIGGGTPGLENSCANIANSNKISLKKEVCHPSLGEEGDVVIEFALDKPNYIADVALYSTSGKCIRHLAESLTIPSQYQIRWDGKDDNDSLLPIAPYIIHISIYEADGFTEIKKIVCTLSE